VADFTKSFRLLLDADTKGAVDGLGNFSAAAKKAEQSTTASSKGISGSIGDMVAKTGLGQKAMSGLGLSAGQMGTAVVGGAAVAGVAVAKFAVEGAAKFGDLGVAVDKFAVVAGVPAETASRFIAVADDYGVGADTISGAVGKLGKALGNNIDALEKYGVAVAVGKDGSTDLAQTTFNVIDAYNATEDPAKKAALGAAAFGKSYQDLIPLIEQGSANIEKSFDDVSKAQLFDDKKVQSAKDYKHAMDDLHDAVTDLQMELGQKLIPTLVDAAKAATTMSSALIWLGDHIPTELITTFKIGLNPLGGAFDALNDKAHELGDTFSHWDETSKPFDRWIVRQLDFLPSFAGEAQVVISSVQDMATATGKAGGASTEAAAREEDLYLAMLERAAASNDVFVATQDMIDQTSYVIDSYKNQLAAIDKLTEGIKGQEQAALGVNASHLSSVSADQAVTDAIDKYNEALRGIPASAAAVESAQDAVTRAQDKYNKSLTEGVPTHLDIEKAQLNLMKAQEKSGKVQANAKATDIDRLGAQIDLEQAQRDYADAVGGGAGVAQAQGDALNELKAAQDALVAANQPTIVSEHDKKQAYLDVQDAINNAAGTHAAEAELLAKEKGLNYDVRDSIDAQVLALQTVEKTLKPGSPLDVAIAAHIQQLKDAAAAADDATTKLSIYDGVTGGGGLNDGTGMIGRQGPHAQGGAFTAGTFLAGERGPELITMAGSGYVSPNSVLGGIGGGGVTINNYFSATAADKAAVGQALAESIAAYERVSGAGWRN
jgi:hypothetical protein